MKLLHKTKPLQPARETATIKSTVAVVAFLVFFAGFIHWEIVPKAGAAAYFLFLAYIPILWEYLLATRRIVKILKEAK